MNIKTDILKACLRKRKMDTLLTEQERQEVKLHMV